MAGVLAVVVALVVAALAAPSGASAELTASDDGKCGGGGTGGGAQSASIPSPPYDYDCDLVASGPDDPDGSGPVRAGPDNCPTVRNGDQQDTDSDGQGDSCDGDDDDDGRTDDQDNCPTLDIPGNGPCPPTDFDSDGVFDDTDNCRTLANEDQANADGDKQGNACDYDDDDDYRGDASDNCPLASNQDQVDRDGDGLGDACDPDSGTIGPDPGPGSGNDRSAPRVRIGLARIQRLSDLMGGMATSVRCSEACAISGQLRRGRRRVARGTATLGGAGRTWLFLRVRGRVAKRLVGGGRARATLRLTVTDASGNVTRMRRVVLLRR